jgi:AbrB family looped-hinge helix DNA binding protein
MKAKIDDAGRVVIPKELRDRYGLSPGTELELISVPDGISLVPARSERRMIRRGRIMAVDTGAGVAGADAFDVNGRREEALTRKSGFSR